MTIEIPGVAVPKERPKATIIPGLTPRARIYTPKKTREWEEIVARCGMITIARGRTDLGSYPIHGPLFAQVTIYVRRPKTVKRAFPDVGGDLDNYVKSILDGLETAGIYKNDSQVVELWARKLYALGIPMVRVILRRPDPASPRFPALCRGVPVED